MSRSVTNVRFIRINTYKINSFECPDCAMDILHVGNRHDWDQIELKAANENRFILVAIDYFTKWVEVSSYVNMIRQVVARFIKKEIIYHYGIPNNIITDNGSNLNKKKMKELCESFKIENHNSAPYRPKMNGIVESTNKNVKKIIQKMVKTYKD